MRNIIESLESRRLFSANLLTNGSFETPVVPGFADFTSGQTIGAGWKVAAGSVDVVSNQAGKVYATQPAAGTQAVDLNGTAPGTITQTVATTKGDKYILKFAYTATPFTTDKASPAIRKMSVFFNGKSVAALSKNVTGETPAKPGWTYISYTVTATGTSTAVEFMSTTPGTLGMMLDDVSLVQLPPTTASISGQVFADGNGDGKKETDAIGLSGWTVWIDINADGKLDAGDARTTTDHFGNFTIGSLEAGTYKVYVVAQSGWKLTTTNGLPVTVTVGQKATGALIGEEPV